MTGQPAATPHEPRSSYLQRRNRALANMRTASNFLADASRLPAPYGKAIERAALEALRASCRSLLDILDDAPESPHIVAEHGPELTSPLTGADITVADASMQGRHEVRDCPAPRTGHTCLAAHTYNGKPVSIADERLIARQDSLATMRASVCADPSPAALAGTHR